MVRIKHGYDYGDYFFNDYSIEVPEGEAEIEVSINNVRTEVGIGYDYGVKIYLEDGKIKAFRITSYDIDVEIPATIDMHNKISRILRGE